MNTELESTGETEKTRAQRLRRAARRQGLTLTKSRTRDPRALDYGRYYLSDAANFVVVGHSYGVYLDDIETALNEGTDVDEDDDDEHVATAA